MPIITDGPMLAADSKGIDEYHTGYFGKGGIFESTVNETLSDLPTAQLSGAMEIERAKGTDIDFGQIATGMATPGFAEEQAKAASVPRMDIIEANDRVKKAGLAKQLTLPDQPDIPPAQLEIMMSRAQARHERETTMERGPQGFVPSALGVGTSFLVGAIDPINIASAFVPVMGELRYGKMLASAAEGFAARSAVRAGVGGAQGAVGQAALEPLDWWSHTQDGRDFGMSDVLHNILFGAALGGAMHAGGGAVSDIYRARKGRELYPFGPGEPLERTAPTAAIGEAHNSPIFPESPDDAHITPASLSAEAIAARPALPSPEIQTIDNLPPRAKEDAARAGIASLIEGEPVRVGEMLDAARQTDPRIAEAFEPKETSLSAPAARESVFDDIHHKLLSAGMDEDQAGYNAALIAARYATRAERLGGNAGNALDLYRAEGLDVRSGEITDAEGRAFHQRKGEGPDLFAQREAEGQTSMPGTERIGQGELAQRKADEALKPRVAQKPLDEGLFGDEQAQKSFFQSRPTAPTFYSAVDRAIGAAKQDKASPEQWLGMLKNAAGVKPEEMKWLGLEDWLKEQKGAVTKDQVQDFVRANQIEVKEVAKGGIDIEKRARELGEAENGPGSWDQIGGGGQEHYYRDARRENGTKYPGYVLPGGEKYREMLLTLPERDVVTHEPSVAPAGWGDTDGGNVGFIERGNTGADFRSSHWAEPNVLAHVRFDDRLSDGKKTLHVAEVQSDWHQAGKRKGYAEAPASFESVGAGKLVDAEHGKWEFDGGEKGPVYVWARTAEEARQKAVAYVNGYRAKNSGAVPDAPFKTTWPELAMKRMIRFAAEHGYERISWDTGATNAERYDLSKQIEKLQYHADKQRLIAIDKKGSVAIDQIVPPEKVADFIGKEHAERLLAAKPATWLPIHELNNADLKVGGEGMAGFYDKILPATVNRLVKKFGAKVEEGSVEKPGGIGQWAYEGPELSSEELRRRAGRATSSVANQMREMAIDLDDGMSFAKAMEKNGSYSAAEYVGGRLKPFGGKERVHAVDITPELRTAAVEQGFPLFQSGAEGARGRITLSDSKAVIDLFAGADKSTFLHETGHLWLDELVRDAGHAAAPEQLRADRDAVLGWLGVKEAGEIGTAQHEKWAEGFEHYLATSEAPSNALARAFEQFRQWMLDVYHAVTGLRQQVSPEIRAVMDRLIATDREIAERGATLQDHADAASAVTTHVPAKQPRGRAAADPETWSLFEYLASKGGLKPDPELEAIFGSGRGPFVPGFGTLVRKSGMPLDEALRSAKDGRYLFDAADVTGAEGRLTPRDLLDRLDDENRKKKVYRVDHAEAEKGIDRDEEARHILDALHDEIEATTGQKGAEVDPALADRVVEIIQKEGPHDVLAAYERAIMEDAERYEGLANVRRQDQATAHLPGWDAADAGAAPRDGAPGAGQRGQAGLPAEAAGRANGAQPRSAGLGNRAPAQNPLASQVDRDAAWRALSHATPDFDEPAVIAASKAAAEVKPPPTKLDERVTAAQKADAYAKQMIDMFADRLEPQERQRLDDLITAIDSDNEAREIAIQRGAACLFGAR